MNNLYNICQELVEQLVTPVVASEDGAGLPHAAWMLFQIPHMEDVEKANRWLGYAQAILVYEGVFSLQEMRDMTREMVNG